MMNLFFKQKLPYFIFFLLYFQTQVSAQNNDNKVGPLSVGYSLPIGKVNLKSMKYAKAAGVSCIETSISAFIDKKEKTFLEDDETIIGKLKIAKAAADEAGIKIWSIHMPFSDKIDLSLTDNAERKKVIALHKKVLKFCKILEPSIILFHPSYYLGLNEREARKEQFIKSAVELNKDVQKIGAQMVVENMWGKVLLKEDGKREWPLFRTVAEATEIMNLLPMSIHAAIDLNHIINPENLILAMGARLATLHVSDDDGVKERHYFPCAGKGINNWNAILGALEKVNYKGPFMYECAIEEVKDLKPCYDKLYSNYKNQK